MLSAKKYRLRIRNLVLRPMIKRLSRKYFGHVNKPSTAASASHRHYVGFPNYVLTYNTTTMSFSGPWWNACHENTSDMSINHRLRCPRLIGITSAFRIAYLLTTRRQCGFRFYEAETTKKNLKSKLSRWTPLYNSCNSSYGLNLLLT